MIVFEGVNSVDALRHSKGLVLYWRNNDKVTISSYSKNHINAIVEIQGEYKYRLTGLYGEPYKAKRSQTCDIIHTLNNQLSLPWCIIGDMNNIMKQEDKRGGSLYPSLLIQGFQQVIDECDLNDLDLEGYRFT